MPPYPREVCSSFNIFGFSSVSPPFFCGVYPQVFTLIQLFFYGKVFILKTKLVCFMILPYILRVLNMRLLCLILSYGEKVGIKGCVQLLHSVCLSGNHTNERHNMGYYSSLCWEGSLIV